jgi:hypothetical protein
MTDLTAIGDIFSHLHNDEPTHASGCTDASQQSYGYSMTSAGSKSPTPPSSS